MLDERRAVDHADIERALADGPKTIGEILRAISADQGGVSLALIGMLNAKRVTVELKDESSPDKPRRWRLVEQEPATPASRRSR
jgi:hypothetical protein